MPLLAIGIIITTQFLPSCFLFSIPYYRCNSGRPVAKSLTPCVWESENLGLEFSHATLPPWDLHQQFIFVNFSFIIFKLKVKFVSILERCFSTLFKLFFSFMLCTHLSILDSIANSNVHLSQLLSFANICSPFSCLFFFWPWVTAVYKDNITLFCYSASSLRE